MRHRAALGVTEQNDVIAIVVSEEKGSIRVSAEGKLIVISSSTELREFLIANTTQNEQSESTPRRTRKKDKKELVSK
jgi:diadenylate cyclase